MSPLFPRPSFKLFHSCKRVVFRRRPLLLAAVGLSLLMVGLVTVRRASAVNGTFSVGPTGTYASLTTAISSINTAGGADGPIVLELQSTYVSTVETFPIVPLINGNSATNTITIRPEAGATNLSITSANATATIDLSGAQNVIFDGQPGGTGGTKQLTIADTVTGGVAIRFINEAQSNTIKYCTVRGVTTSATSGVVFFSTTTGANGNDNNTIDNCDIRDGATTPANGIFSLGTITTAAQNNSGNMISNNNIFNFFSNSATIGNGVLISSGNTDWTITGNSFYQTTTRTFTVAAAGFIGISVNNTSGNNFTISNNFIGGSAASAGGTAWTQTGAVTHTFIGIRVAVGTTTASNLQGNTIQNISISTSTTSTINAGISAVTGSMNIGTTMANTIGSSAATGSIAFTGAGAAAQLTGILAGTGTPGVINISNNTIGGITVAGAGTTTLRGINLQGTGTSYTVTGNTIGSTSTANSISNSTNREVAGIVSSSATTSVTISTNTIANLTTTGTSTANQLVGISTSSGVNTITGNTVRNLSSTSTIATANSTASVIGVSQTSTTASQVVSQNTIHTLSNNAAAAAVNVVGIFYSGPATGTNLIARNFVHSFSTTSVTAVQQGINAGTTTGIGTFQNNMVRLGIDASGASITTSAAITGILKATTGNTSFYFNSVFIGGSSVVGGAINTFAFRRTATGTDDIRDNIFVNSRSNTSGTARHYAYVLNATTTTTSDYNIYLANGTGGNLASVDTGTTALTTLAALQGALGQDSHSQNADPLFVNPTGTSATVDLHIQTGFATPVEGLGVDILSVTDDFDGQTRSSLTPVDIGADAGAFVSSDVSPPVISYSPLGNTSSLSNRVLTATIVDATGVPTTGGFVPRIYYKKNSDPYFSQPGTLSIGNGQSGTWTFTIVVADMGGVGGGDTISYFVIAQDRVGNLASNPSGAVASDVNTVTTPPASPNTYQIPNISGSFNVGTGGDYATLTAAVAAYNGAVASGPVTFRLTDATYPSETFPITINANNGSSATNTLTIVPASGVSPTISGSSTTSIFKLNAADYVVIDGSNNGTSTRDLTISNTSTGSATAVIWLSSTGAGAGATNNVIKNCNLAAGADESANTTNTFAILSSGATIIVSDDGADNDSNTFTNNSITKARYGIFLRGAAANTNDNNVISNNLIGPTAFGTSEIGTDGIVIQHQNLATITQNEVRFVGGDRVNRSATGVLKAIGIGVGSDTWTPTSTAVTNSTITRNLVHDIVDERTGSAVGIVVAGTGTPSANVVANNMVYNIHSNGTLANQTVGIGIGTGNGDKVCFNSISLGGDLDPSGSNAATQSAVGIRISSTSATNLTLKNNITSVDVNSNTGSVHHFSIVAPSTAYLWGTGAANNNDYYVNTGNAQMRLGGLGTGTSSYTEVTTLSSWRTQFTPNQDAASQNVNPPFISATNLHLSNAIATALESGGASISGITDDFDGETRNSPPDVGADEGAFTAGFANDIAASAFIDPTNGGTKQAGVAFSPQASFANVGTSSQTNVPVRYRIVDSGSVEVYNQTTTIASLPFGTTATATFPSATLASGGAYTIFAKAELAGDGNSLDDEISGSITVVVPISGSHTVGTGQEYTTVTAALADLNIRGVSGPATLLLTSTYSSGGETFPITISPITGASLTNTVTIKPDTGVSPSISGSSSSCVLRLSGADYIVIDGSNTNGGTSRNLTITNTNNATNTAGICLVSLGASAGATNNTIKNTNISTGVDQSTNSANQSFAILSSGAAILTTSDGLDNDSNTFTNNFITKARYGIYLRGASSNLNDNNTISGNLIGPAAFGSSEIGAAGVELQYQNTASVTQNEVRFVGNLVAQSGFLNSRAGIAVGGIGDSPWQPGSPTNLTNSSITRNLVHDIVDEREFSAVGIILAGVGLPSNNVVANNMIYGIRSNGTGGDQALGIGIANGDGDKVVFNSVSLTGDLDPAGTVATTGSAAALRIDSVAVTNLTLKDNIFAVDVSSNTGALKHYTIEAPSSSYSWGTGGANNNDFYFNGSNSQMALGGLGTPVTDATFTTVSSLASWKTTFTPNQDGSSISANPLFTSATNLHISSSGSPVNGVGTPIVGVTTDFDGETRDASTPDIGADELLVNFSSSGDGNLPAGTYDNVTINSPHVITLTGNITVNTAIIVKSGATLNCGTFIFSGPATFLIEAGGTLGVGDPNGIATSGATGNIQVGGARTYTPGSNYTYNGGSAQVTGNGLPASVNNLTVNNGAGVSLSQNATVDGTLALNSGALSIGPNTLILNGAINTTGGSLTGGASSNITFGGAGAGTALPAVTLNNLTINRANGISLGGSVTVGGTLALTSGDLTTTDLFMVTENGASSGTGDVIGTVQRSDVGAAPVAFGNPNVQITNDTSMTLKVLLVKAAPDSFPAAVTRVYSLNIVSGSVGIATVRLHYLDSELNGNVGADLHLWRAEGSPGATFTDQGPASNSQSAANPNNWIENSGVTGFSSWTLASAPSAPTAVKLTKFNATHYSNGVQLYWESGYEVDNLGYNLYREQNGVRTQVTPAVVAGSALKVGRHGQLTAGYSYSWFDRQGTPDSSYYLESIDLNGESVASGPIYPAHGSGEKAASATTQQAMLLTDVAATAPANAFEQSWPGSVESNPGQSSTAPVLEKQMAAATAGPGPLATVQQSIASGRAVKISITRDGWYRVTQPELVAAGLDPNSDARRLQLYVDGEEIPVRINGADQIHLGAGDSIEFYGRALDTLTTNTHVYWLINGTALGKRIASPKPAKPPSKDWADGLTGGNFTFTTERKDKMVYFAGLLNGEGENIFGPPVTSGSATQTLTVRNLDPNSAQAQLAVVLQGVTDVDHAVQVKLNGTPVGTISFTGREHPLRSFSVARALLREGDNDVTLVATGGPADVSLIDSVALTYAHAYRADNNSLRFVVPGGQTVLVGGFNSSEIRVIDITNPTNPEEVAPTIGPLGGSYALKLQATGTATRVCSAFTNVLISPAAAVAANQPSNLNSVQSADMLIVTHKDFRAAVEPLAAQRRSEGLAVTVVDIEDVYDEFSFGAHTPYALRDFIGWARGHWVHAPRYLLLAGDSSWDPRNYLAQGFGDFVPTKLIDTAYMETASDDWVADSNGDGVSDIALGRLPGRTSAEVSRMVSKILLYEQERQQATPPRGALMVSDTGFEAENQSTAALLPSNITVQSLNRSEVGSDDLMRGQIVNALNNGPLIVNYFGHGSVTVWTGAGLLDSDLAATLTNNNKPTLFVMMTCLNGYTHDAYIDSLAESLLKAQNGGAMAVWASSGFTEPEPQFGMSTQFYQQLFSTPSMRLGDAIKVAKTTTSDSDVRRTWVLLGDPSMRLR